MMCSITKLLNLGRRGYSLFVKAGCLSQFLLLLFFRINWGWQFYTTGLGKLTNHQHVVDFFTSLNLPLPDPTAWFVGMVECLGGILLIIGLATRPIGLILTVNMVVAYLSVEDDRTKLLNFFTDQDPFFAADPFFFLLTALLAFSFGAGSFSVDAWIHKLLREHK